MIELTTSLLMLATAFSTYGGAPAQTDQGPTAAETATATTAVTQPIPSDHPLTTSASATSTEVYVRKYYKDTPILADVAGCESSFRQFDSNGNVVMGKVNKGDIGIMQIHKYYNGENAEKLGYDIYTIEGNLAYAKVLYKKFGTDPWSSSEKCWQSSVVAMKQ